MQVKIKFVTAAAPAHFPGGPPAGPIAGIPIRRWFVFFVVGVIDTRALTRGEGQVKTSKAIQCPDQCNYVKSKKYSGNFPRDGRLFYINGNPNTIDYHYRNAEVAGHCLHGV